MKVLVKFGDSRSNRSLDLRLPHFVTNDDHGYDAGIRQSSQIALHELLFAAILISPVVCLGFLVD